MKRIANFLWDHLKAEKNIKKHGVSLEVAITDFNDPFALISVDEKHSRTEKREWLLGESYDTTAGRNIYLLISARKENRKERKQYVIRR